MDQDARGIELVERVPADVIPAVDDEHAPPARGRDAFRGYAAREPRSDDDDVVRHVSLGRARPGGWPPTSGFEAAQARPKGPVPSCGVAAVERALVDGALAIGASGSP